MGCFLWPQPLFHHLANCIEYIDNNSQMIKSVQNLHQNQVGFLCAAIRGIVLEGSVNTNSYRQRGLICCARLAPMLWARMGLPISSVDSTLRQALPHHSLGIHHYHPAVPLHQCHPLRFDSEIKGSGLRCWQHSGFHRPGKTRGFATNSPIP